MNETLIALLIISIITLGLDVFVIWLLAPRRGQTGARALELMVWMLAIWTAASGMQLIYLDLPTNITWSKIAYLGIVNIAPLFLVFALEYTGREHWISARNLAWLWVVPVLTLILVFTNEWHMLIWSSIDPGSEATALIPAYSHGLGYWVLIIYMYLLMLFGSILLVWSVLSLQKFHRRQVVAVLVGVPLPWLANILYIARLSPIPNWDLAPIAFSLTALALSLGIYRFHLLDLAPLARNKVYESLSDGLVVLDLKDRIVDINPAAVRMVGRKPAELVGQAFDSVFPILALPFRKEGLQEVLQPGEDPAWTELSVVVLSDSRQKQIGHLVVLHDITERKQAEHQLEEKSHELARLAVTDGLTQLYNRRYAEEALKSEFLRAERYQVPLALAMFDIDLFKQINDRFGHSMGDEVLRKVSLCLTETMRTTDILARVGGDEFLVLLPNTSLADAWQALERLRVRLADPMNSPIGDPVNISGGVTAWFAGDRPADAMRRADRLLYEAKAAGRKTICMDPPQAD